VGEKKTLLGDNMGNGTVMLRPFKFQCVGVCAYIYTDNWPHRSLKATVRQSRICNLDFILRLNCKI